MCASKHANLQQKIIVDRGTVVGCTASGTITSRRDTSGSHRHPRVRVVRVFVAHLSVFGSGLFLAESETIVNKDHSLLFCAPPNAGSLQFRMLAKRMQVGWVGPRGMDWHSDAPVPVHQKCNVLNVLSCMPQVVG